MKKVLVFIVTCVLSASAYAQNKIELDKKFYIGAGVQYTKVGVTEDYVHFLKRNHPGLGVFAGWRFHDYFGLELGYDWTTRESKHNDFASGIVLFNSLVVDTATQIDGKVRHKNLYLDFNTYLPLWNTRNDFFVSIGVVSSRPHITAIVTPTSSNVYTELNDLNGKTHYHLHIGVGIEGMFNKYWGYKGTFRLANTNGMTTRGTVGNISEVVFKNSGSVHLSLFRYIE